MDGTAVTLALGELSEDAAPADGASSDNDSQQPPEMPSGDSGSSQPSGTPPERPDGSTGGKSSAAIRSDRGGCTWTLTGDCVITSLTNNGTINFNGYTITLADGTVLQ